MHLHLPVFPLVCIQYYLSEDLEKWWVMIKVRILRYFHLWIKFIWHDILVTRATDLGWTTLFLNAGGVLLEIGGTLQHGASVARESCKLRIVGLNNITMLLEDGQIVEMDGSTGVVKILEWVYCLKKAGYVDVWRFDPFLSYLSNPRVKIVIKTSPSYDGYILYLVQKRPFFPPEKMGYAPL